MIQLLAMQFVLLLGSEAANDSTAPVKVKTSEYQWLVAVVGFSRQNDIFICTGAAISKTQILSSAWCLEQMPGEVTLLSGKAVEDYVRPANFTIKESSLFDNLNVLGCLKYLIFHPCYRKVEKCTNTLCDRVSWKCDLVVLVTIEEMKTDVAVMDLNFVNWNLGEDKDCGFTGFDFSRMYDKNKNTDNFVLVQSKMKSSRGQLPCKMSKTLTEHVVWSSDEFVGKHRFLGINGGFLTCSNQTAGIFLGKLGVKTCTIQNQYDHRSPPKFRMSWTYLLPHKKWIDEVIAHPSKFANDSRTYSVANALASSKMIFTYFLVVMRNILL